MGSAKRSNVSQDTSGTNLRYVLSAPKSQTSMSATTPADTDWSWKGINASPFAKNPLRFITMTCASVWMGCTGSMENALSVRKEQGMIITALRVSLFVAGMPTMKRKREVVFAMLAITWLTDTAKCATRTKFTWKDGGNVLSLVKKTRFTTESGVSAL